MRLLSSCDTPILLLLLTLCLAVSAGAETSSTVTYSEPYGRSLRITADITETAHARYLFAPAIPAPCGGTARDLPVGGLFLRRRAHRRASALPRPMDWDSTDFAALVLQAAAGQYSHYGLVHGPADVLRGHTGAFVRPGQSAVFDLNLLCFDPAFASQADAAAAGQLSAAFAAAYADVHGIEGCWTLLCASAMAARRISTG